MYLDRNISNKQLEIDHYKILHRDRNTGSIGGGCLVYLAHHTCFSCFKSPGSSDIEGIWLKIMLNLTNLALGIVYRHHLILHSLSALILMFERVWLKYRYVMIDGDLNSDFTTNTGMILSNVGRKLNDVDYSVVNLQDLQE